MIVLALACTLCQAMTVQAVFFEGWQKRVQPKQGNIQNRLRITSGYGLALSITKKG
jgi:hypothetical protein